MPMANPSFHRTILKNALLTSQFFCYLARLKACEVSFSKDEKLVKNWPYCTWHHADNIWNFNILPSEDLLIIKPFYYLSEESSFSDFYESKMYVKLKITFWRLCFSNMIKLKPHV